MLQHENNVFVKSRIVENSNKCVANNVAMNWRHAWHRFNNRSYASVLNSSVNNATACTVGTDEIQPAFSGLPRQNQQNCTKNSEGRVKPGAAFGRGVGFHPFQL